MANRLLAITRGSIPYVPELKRLLKDTNATIMMQQLEYWFDKNGGKSFYKFRDKPKQKHKAYREGDSWAEELVFNAKEITAAFKEIGIAYKSKGDFSKTTKNGKNPFINDGKEYFYCSYHDRMLGLTYYFRNNKIIDKFLDDLCRRDQDEKPDFTVKAEMDFTVKDESGFTVSDKLDFIESPNRTLHYTETTTETTNRDNIIIINSKHKNSEDLTADEADFPPVEKDLALEKLIKVFEGELGRPLTGMDCEHITDWLNAHFSEELIIEALRRGVSAGIRNFRYLDSILREWEKKGIKTIPEVEHDDLNFQGKNGTKKSSSKPERKTKPEKYADFYL